MPKGCYKEIKRRQAWRLFLNKNYRLQSDVEADNDESVMMASDHLKGIVHFSVNSISTRKVIGKSDSWWGSK